MLRFYESADMAREMAKRRLPKASPSAIRKAVQAGRLAPSGRTVGSRNLIWTEADAMAAIDAEIARLDARDARIFPEPDPKKKKRPRR